MVNVARTCSQRPCDTVDCEFYGSSNVISADVERLLGLLWRGDREMQCYDRPGEDDQKRIACLFRQFVAGQPHYIALLFSSSFPGHSCTILYHMAEPAEERTRRLGRTGYQSV